MVLITLRNLKLDAPKYVLNWDLVFLDWVDLQDYLINIDAIFQ